MSLRESRKWMYNKNLPGYGALNDEFIAGVTEFIKYVSSQPEQMDGSLIRCPCKKCDNLKFFIPDEVMLHLCRKGFIANYFNWTCHGEKMWHEEEQFVVNQLPQQTNWWDQGFRNFEDTGCSFAAHSNFDDDASNYCHENPSVLHDEAGPSIQEPREDAKPYVDEVVRSPQCDDTTDLCDSFIGLLKDVDKPLYDGCETYTQLSLVAKMLSMKFEYNQSVNHFNENARVFKNSLPRENTLPEDFYGYKRLLRDLGLPVVKIDACRDGCMLFWKSDEHEKFCKFCKLPRYKQREETLNNPMHKRVAYAILRYLPLTPRLQRLYASKVTAPHMTWHATHETNQGVMCHPSDAEAWKHFDRTHPSFASEPRNIRLGLCADGFSPHSQYGQAYSCWPVITTPYNLPPGMCMKNPYMFLSLICPGPKNPKKNIDVFLQPLIEELKHLWEVGVETYDINLGKKFNMRAALLWTINDFPTYGMLSRWSTSGLLGCPICMEKSKAFYLHHGKKISYFDCHRQFLPMNHSYRRDKSTFIRGRAEMSRLPPRLTGDEIWNRVSQYKTVIEDPRGKTPHYGNNHKWNKKSIFWELPYWRTNMIRHNLDVMHIEKNVFDNIMDTIFDIPGKTKDNLNVRKDLHILCDRPELHVPIDNTVPHKPKAKYTLTKNEKVKICSWVRALRFPDGYASNLGRCVDINECRLKKYEES
ncbi:uncharacterized protein LOC120283984 [Dioscorea cayenensis subsp. rotundata]|uniref:Uncharacterized protein LOC120283984 n=1 Tax=Dioscorea cayennensis subsp. rotundata TaxID=55577 RepID=A0AB40D5Q3_DIOCR|nr:uncharacterized protein LOC120283984 [Dioscorea cayenensis subsp. rotundata]